MIGVMKAKLLGICIQAKGKNMPYGSVVEQIVCLYLKKKMMVL